MDSRRAEKLATALRTGQTAILDRMGQPLKPGAVVVYETPSVLDVVWQVADVRPDLNPASPAGTVRVTLTTSVTVAVPAGTPVRNVLKIGQVSTESQGTGDGGYSPQNGTADDRVPGAIDPDQVPGTELEPPDLGHSPNVPGTVPGPVLVPGT